MSDMSVLSAHCAGLHQCQQMHCRGCGRFVYSPSELVRGSRSREGSKGLEGSVLIWGEFLSIQKLTIPLPLVIALGLVRAKTAAVILAEFCYLGAGDQGVVDAKGAVLVPQADHEPRSKTWKKMVSFKTLRIDCNLTLLYCICCFMSTLPFSLAALGVWSPSQLG